MPTRLKHHIEGYSGALMLGINDALVEMLGALTGFTFALQDNVLIASVGLIMGIAASLSMAAAEYLAVQEDGSRIPPFRAAIYTGSAYVISVLLLILPYLIFNTPLLAWLFSISMAIGIIALFNLVLARFKQRSVWSSFWRMLVIIFGVTLISYLLGLILHDYCVACRVLT